MLNPPYAVVLCIAAHLPGVSQLLTSLWNTLWNIRCDYFHWTMWKLPQNLATSQHEVDQYPEYSIKWTHSLLVEGREEQGKLLAFIQRGCNLILQFYQKTILQKWETSWGLLYSSLSNPWRRFPTTTGCSAASESLRWQITGSNTYKNWDFHSSIPFCNIHPL